MGIGFIRALLAMFAGLQGVFYAIANIANFEAAKGFMGLVLAQPGHELYPAAIMPSITSPLLVVAALILVLALELGGGLLAVLGGAKMLLARGDRREVESGVNWAITGLGLLVLCWFGLFLSIGTAAFQMWQIPAGATAMEGAFIYGASSALVMIILMVGRERLAPADAA